MKKLLVLAVSLFALASCQTLDAQIVKINSSVQNYCDVLETAGAIAQSLDNKPLVTKINGGVSAYCNGPVTDIPSALIALAKIYKAVHDAGITNVSLAAN